MTQLNIKTLYGDVYTSPDKVTDRQEKLYGGRLADRPQEAKILSEATKEILRKVRDSGAETRMRATLGFLDSLVLRGIQMSCLSVKDVRDSETGFTILNGPSDDGQRKLYVGYYLGCAAAERDSDLYKKLEYSMLWLTSKGLASSSADPSKSSRIEFIDDAFTKTESLGLYIMSEAGLDPIGALEPINIRDIIQEWNNKTADDRIPISEDTKNVFTLGAGLLAFKVVDSIYSVMGMRGIDMLLYGIYRRLAGIKEWSDSLLASEKAIYEAILCPDDAAAVFYALEKNGPLSVFLNTIPKEDATNLNSESTYSFDDFSLFIPTLTDLLDRMFIGKFNNDRSRYMRACEEDALGFEDSLSFARFIYAAEAIYNRRIYKGTACDPKEMAKVLYAFPELKTFIDGIYRGMSNIDEGGTYREKNIFRDDFYSKITESEKYRQLKKDMEWHKDHQFLKDNLFSEDGQAETPRGLVTANSPYSMINELLGDASSVLNDEETVRKYLKEIDRGDIIGQ